MGRRERVGTKRIRKIGFGIDRDELVKKEGGKMGGRRRGGRGRRGRREEKRGKEGKKGREKKEK
ncbi:hypothetical protein [Leuconostoc mesenteroides]|uniref:hypothetical protein n=1 Tax=Leuconostoc mesenteroides TaxID=1245 RepID=UPI001CBB8B21|nr:hypothetical protein [Leuconostoc mesenteroides]MBZ1521868.1 hypothetical protein [Leuconostoc mesenteroides]